MLDHPQAATTGGGIELPNAATRAMRDAPALFRRTMPGGGCVQVELMARGLRDVAAGRPRGRVVLEPRAVDGRPLVVEEVEGDDENQVVGELIRIARDNAAIARRILRRRPSVPRAD